MDWWVSYGVMHLWQLVLSCWKKWITAAVHKLKHRKQTLSKCVFGNCSASHSDYHLHHESAQGLFTGTIIPLVILLAGITKLGTTLWNGEQVVGVIWQTIGFKLFFSNKKAWAPPIFVGATKDLILFDITSLKQNALRLNNTKLTIFDSVDVDNLVKYSVSQT